MTTKNFNVKNGLTTGNITLDAATGNITASNANLGNLVTANYFSGSGNNLSNIQGVNVTGAVSSATSATTAGTVTTAAQPNITSVGTLSSLTVTANVAAGNVLTDHLLYANGTAWTFMSVAGSNTQIQFNDNGVFGGTSGLTFNKTSNALTVGGNITGTNITGTLTTAAQPNITSVGTLTSLTVTGNVTAGNLSTSGSGGNISGANNVTANFFIGNGASLSAIAGANVTGQVGNALVAGTVYTAAQPNITSVGTLTSVTVTGDATIGGNLTVGGSTTYVNVTTVDIKDPIIELGGGSNGAALTSNDSKDRGTLLHYYSGGVVDAFMGWDNSNAEFALASNVTLSGEVATFNTFGNLRIGNVIGNGQALTGINGSNVTGQVGNALVAGTVYTNAQPNITSVGTLTSLTVGNATANVKITTANGNGFLTATGNITAPYFIGNVVGNISGTITVPGNNTAVLFNQTGNAGASDAFTFNYSSNVLTIGGNIVSSNANLGNLATANYFSGSGNNLSNIQGANVTGQVGNALVAGTVYTNAQPNITSVGTLTTLTVSGNVIAQSKLLVGTSSTTLTNPVAVFSGSGASYDQVAIMNSTGTGSADLAVYGNNGDDTQSWADIGFTGNTFSDANYTVTAAGDGYFFVQGNASFGGNMVIATGNKGTTNDIIFSTGGFLTGNIKARLYNANGALSVTGGYLGNLITAAQPNITSVGTLTSLVVSGNSTTGNSVITGGITSNRANVTVTTNTVIDEFSPTTFRTAKYVLSASGTNGYQSAEVLLVQDGTNSYITIYGSLCSNASADIVDFSSNINGVSGNVSLYATASGASTKVNLVAMYLKT